MKSHYSNIMQSPYFDDQFNSAIFDGPIRIYFAQRYEEFALKIYFLIQNKFKNEIQIIKDEAKNSASNIFVMIYPKDQDTDGTDGHFEEFVQIWHNDIVVGLSNESSAAETDVGECNTAKNMTDKGSKISRLLQSSFQQWRLVHEQNNLFNDSLGDKKVPSHFSI